MILLAIFQGTSQYLKRWLEIGPENAVTVLDICYGIGVIDIGPEKEGNGRIDGLFPESKIHELVETIHLRSRGESRKATGASANNLDLYQVNCTFYDALGEKTTNICWRTLKFFAPEIPQVYYVGMLGGHNDASLLEKTGVGL